jgi:riboflavin kinase / FMN adenylyltransferase
MQIIRDVTRLPSDAKGATIAIGNFDGVHLGHQAIFTSSRKTADTLNTPLAAITFDPYPREFFKSGQEPFRLMRNTEKFKAIEALGINYLYLFTFDAKLASMSADTFVGKVLVEVLQAKHIVTGSNFCFGKDRLGTDATLKNHAETGVFSYDSIAPVMVGGEIVSSSLIRQKLREGEVAKATKLLGKPHRIVGDVIRGEGQGKTLGVATANIAMDGLFLPRLGIYTAHIISGGKTYQGVASIGTKPTFGNYPPRLEVHIFDFNNDLYDKEIAVDLLSYQREEITFETEDALVKQMQDDIQIARRLHETL